MSRQPLVPAELLDRVVSYSHPRRAIVFGSQSLFESGISMGYAATVVSILPSMEVLSRKAPVWCLPNACRHKAGMLLQPTNSSNPLKWLTQTGSNALTQNQEVSRVPMNREPRSDILDLGRRPGRHPDIADTSRGDTQRTRSGQSSEGGHESLPR